MSKSIDYQAREKMFDDYTKALRRQTRLSIIHYYENNKDLDTMIDKNLVNLQCCKFNIHLLYKCLFIILVCASVLIN
ncbi:MAG: hypothetical protein [Bacteriophage sp.]|nr:MAG: hypothetical protein [Bacteriophage sp.]